MKTTPQAIEAAKEIAIRFSIFRGEEINIAEIIDRAFAAHIQAADLAEKALRHFVFVPGTESKRLQGEALAAYLTSKEVPK